MDSNYLKSAIGPVLASALKSLLAHSLPDPEDDPWARERRNGNRFTDVADGFVSDDSADFGASKSSKARPGTQSTGAFKPTMIPLPSLLARTDPITYLGRYLLHHDGLIGRLQRDRDEGARVAALKAEAEVRERKVAEARRKVFEDMEAVLGPAGSITREVGGFVAFGLRKSELPERLREHVEGAEATEAAVPEISTVAVEEVVASSVVDKPVEAELAPRASAVEIKTTPLEEGDEQASEARGEEEEEEGGDGVAGEPDDGDGEVPGDEVVEVDAGAKNEVLDGQEELDDEVAKQ
ncbi:hypothetical protein HK101_007824 [Irineochytrium annulatum]|nr:hypothetical protein HK101_007824 [Irineochytrium annulatum]